MHGVKVYLKSGRDRLYRLVVALAGLSVLGLAFMLFDAGGTHVGTLLLYLAIGLALVVQLFLPRKMKKAFRYLPTLFLCFMGCDLMFGFLFESDGWEWWRWSLGPALVLLGLVCPLVLAPRFAYFSPRRLYIRYNPFQGKQYDWSEVKGLELDDRSLEVVLNGDRTIQLVPSAHNSQHLRSYVNEIWLAARQQA